MWSVFRIIKHGLWNCEQNVNIPIKDQVLNCLLSSLQTLQKEEGLCRRKKVTAVVRGLQRDPSFPAWLHVLVHLSQSSFNCSAAWGRKGKVGTINKIFFLSKHEWHLCDLRKGNQGEGALHNWSCSGANIWNDTLVYLTSTHRCNKLQNAVTYVRRRLSDSWLKIYVTSVLHSSLSVADKSGCNFHASMQVGGGLRENSSNEKWIIQRRLSTLRHTFKNYPEVELPSALWYMIYYSLIPAFRSCNIYQPGSKSDFSNSGENLKPPEVLLQEVMDFLWMHRVVSWTQFWSIACTWHPSVLGYQTTSPAL